MRELKAEKIRDMTEDEIENRIREVHEEIFNLRFRNAMRQLQNPVLIRERKRDIARMRTILTEHRKGVRKLSGHTDAAAPAGGAAKAPKAVREPAKAPAKAAKEPARAVKESKREPLADRKKSPQAAKKSAKSAKEPKK